MKDFAKVYFDDEFGDMFIVYRIGWLTSFESETIPKTLLTDTEMKVLLKRWTFIGYL